MPKIIEEAQRKILSIAKEQMLANGYSGLAIRDVARACNIATGTVYNYYPSKDMLAASVILEDWMDALDKMRAGSQNSEKVNDGLKTIHQSLISFQHEYAHIWSGYAFTGMTQEAFRKQHKLLVGQLVSIIRMLLEKHGMAQNDFIYTFLAESLLTAMGQNMAFDPLSEIIDRILQCQATNN
jgi:AcrR family transcriptional regulator